MEFSFWFFFLFNIAIKLSNFPWICVINKNNTNVRFSIVRCWKGARLAKVSRIKFFFFFLLIFFFAIPCCVCGTGSKEKQKGQLKWTQNSELCYATFLFLCLLYKKKFITCNSLENRLVLYLYRKESTHMWECELVCGLVSYIKKIAKTGESLFYCLGISIYGCMSTNDLKDIHKKKTVYGT